MKTTPFLLAATVWNQVVDATDPSRGVRGRQQETLPRRLHSASSKGGSEDNGQVVSKKKASKSMKDGGSMSYNSKSSKSKSSKSATAAPTTHITLSPTPMESQGSSSPTTSPSSLPTVSPTKSPSLSPSQTPSRSPTTQPSASPTTGPSSSPSTSPSVGPSSSPSVSPTKSPSSSPSESPTKNPTESPSTTCQGTRTTWNFFTPIDLSEGNARTETCINANASDLYEDILPDQGVNTTSYPTLEDCCATEQGENDTNDCVYVDTCDGPVLEDDFATTLKNEPIDLGVGTPDFVLNNDPYIPSTFMVDFVQPPKNGKIVMLSYSPNLDFCGNDTFVYEVTDTANLPFNSTGMMFVGPSSALAPTGKSSTAVVTVTVDCSPTPSGSPTKSPSSSKPTVSQSKMPSIAPSSSPTKSPVVTSSPTTSPIKKKTLSPSESPTASPTSSPTKTPTSQPTISPSTMPPINNGEECSVVMPIDFNTKFQRGNYEGFPGGYECYRTVEGTRDTVNDFLVTYPQLTSEVMLPYPTEELGTNLSVLVITNNQTDSKQKGKMLAISSIHAAELKTSETMIRFAEYLLQNYGVDPEVTWILDYTEIHLILIANPDGRVYLEEYTEANGNTTLWRKNRNQGNCTSPRFGVDPNRNFPFKWGQCDPSEGSGCRSSSDCNNENYRGLSEGSEQESKAIIQYAESVFPAAQRKGNLQQSEAAYNTTSFPESTTEGIFLDMHSFGRYVGWPWGFKNERSLNDESLGALGRKLASYSEYRLWAPQMPNRQYSFPGSTIDTMHGWLGAASFFFELGTSFYQPCDEFPTVINDAFPALLYAAKVAKSPYTTPRGPDILCTTIARSGSIINVTVEVSDNARVVHLDDGGSLFPTGQQDVTFVEIYVNCHPYSSDCQTPAVRESISNPNTTATVSLQFQAPAGSDNNVMYIRAEDSTKQAGSVTARSFV